jgi:hypothetical protein
VRRVDASGRIDTIAGGGELRASGVDARDARAPFAETLRVLPGERVLAGRTLFAGPSEPRLLVGMPERGSTYPRAVTRRGAIPVVVSRAARVDVELRYRSRRLLRTSRSLPAGRSAVRLPERREIRKPGVWWLVVTARSGTAIATTRVYMFRSKEPTP